MKSIQILIVMTVLSGLYFASTSRAEFITAIQSGSWGDTNIWDIGTVPGTDDDVFVASGVNVIVETNAIAKTISDDTTGGKVTMSANSSLTILGNFATYQLTTLDTTAVGNTVIYAGNPFYAKQCNYYNLVFANTNYVDPVPPYLPYEYFNNFSSPLGPTPMTIFGNMTLIGHAKVQQASGGAPITIRGNLIIGAGCAWDCSGDVLTVVSNLYIYGTLQDLNGAAGTNYFGGNVVIDCPGTNVTAYAGGPTINGWQVSDVITWGVGGNLTNNGYIFGSGYGSIHLEGTGNIAGTNTIKIPTMTVNGTYMIGNTIILTTNTPTLTGTLVFDLARTNRLVLLSDAGTPLYYDGALNVINSGAAPVSGNNYRFFEAPSFDGAFTSVTLPSLSGGLSWEINLLSSGSIMVIGGGGGGSPAIMLSQSGSTLTMTWDTAAFPGYSVQAKTNSTGISGGVWADAGSGAVSPFEIQISPANPGVYFRLVK